MSASTRSTAVGVFENGGQAQVAVDELRRAGFRDEQIGFVARDQDRSTDADADADAGSGAATGAVTGGLIGGLLGAAAALLIPGIGPVVAGGILASALGGAAIGATAGGLLGALAGLGVPEEEARYYEGEFQSGRTVVTVQADGRYEEAVAILRQNGGYDYGQRTPMSQTTGTGTTAGTYGTTTGSSTAGSATSTSDSSMGTSRTVAPGGGQSGASRTFTSGEMRDDTSRGGGSTSSSIGGSGSTGGMMQNTDTATTRRADGGEIETPTGYSAGVGVGSDPKVTAGTTGGSGTYGGGVAWEDVSTSYRSDFEQNYGQSGRRWEDAEPAYRYAHETASNPTYRGRDFNEVESNLRSDYAQWAQSRGYRFDDNDDAWQRLREDVRSAWNRVRNA